MRLASLAGAALVASTAPPALASAAAGQGDSPPVVRTASGLARGEKVSGTNLFEGLPYAKPPVGTLRWRSPRPPEPWAGTRDATTPGSPCVQAAPTPGQTTGSEDCLYLNVQAPQRISGSAPVIVFLHGGGFTSGSGDVYDGTRLTREGAVVVTVNYRLGALGFLDHRASRDPASGNFGLADQAAALRWVRANIGRFGGNPRNVTLWGQSAGGFSVCAQIASPLARGLFDKAIVQSAPCGNPALTRPQARARAASVTQAVGCVDAPDALACLRSRPAAQIVVSSPPNPPLARRGVDRTWLPVAGTPVLPVQPLTALRHGAADRIALIQGGTREEMRGFVAGRYGADPLTAEQFPGAVRDLYGAEAAAVLRRYRLEDYPAPGAALAAILTDEGRFIGACQQLPANDASRGRVYAYEFAQPSSQPGGDFPLGAFHTSDLRYLLDSRGGAYPQPPLTPEEAPLGEEMVRHWTTFASTGRPGAGWPAYRPGKALSLSIGETKTVDIAAEHHCDFWRSVG
ncbi:carboxylesterase/lipase family protein [Luteipulveratus mongoliensis]|uniref:Carboxylic ester hydrolase n=1 Tax=Luteipulveratus mongoliensis TaxID=571913 RepID=A0A0K1JRG4_9MICO|nr:carboxylesterase family protein [Luteipulveratus mongoliensis]AKU19302.1 hypothetical protein VV02_25205 [Luteipulveratus mongoliensis]